MTVHKPDSSATARGKPLQLNSTRQDLIIAGALGLWADLIVWHTPAMQAARKMNYGVCTIPDARQVREWYDLTLPADAPSGEYTLWLGAYSHPSVSRLPVRSASPLARDDMIALGVVQVRP